MRVTIPDAILGDLTVLDLSGEIAGPYCTKLLAALGARVIKVEPPAGDAGRRMSPFFEDDAHAEKSGVFLYLNTSKESLALDLDNPAGAALIRRFVPRVDIFVESHPPGVLAARGLGYDDLRRLKPDLIYASITPFGQTGPYRDYQGSEIVIEALSGLLYTMGLPDREPLKIGGNAALMTGGISAFSAIMAAIHYRDETGEGQFIDVSLLESTAVTQIHASLAAQYTDHEPGRRPSTISRAKDGWITVGIQQGAWPKFCEMIGRPDLVDDPRVADWPSRQKNPQVIDEAMAGWLAEQSKEAVYHSLQSMRSVAGYIADVSDLFRSAQYQAREFFRPVDHPVTGAHAYPGPAFRVDDLPWRQERAPLLGEHTESVLEDFLELPPDEVAALRQQGVIR